VNILGCELPMKVFILLLQGKHQPMETRIQLAINYQSIILNDSPYKLTIGFSAFLIINLLEIVYPIILRVVLYIRQLASIDILLHH